MVDNPVVNKSSFKVDPEGNYELEPHDVEAGSMPVLVFRNSEMAVYAVRVTHGAFPALAWRVEMGGKRIAFSGDTNGEGDGLTQLALDADLFVAHNAVPEDATGVERRLHMPPSVIGMLRMLMSSDWYCRIECCGLLERRMRHKRK
jgi:ribonuclease BN (tRNA processing enzyme)